MRFTLAVAMVLLVMVVPSRAQVTNWQLTATVAESCSCTVSCPCNFGGEPSRMPCEGNRFITIDKGHYQDVDLAGVQLLVTFNMRNWSKIYVSEKVSERQMKAVEAMLPLAFAGFHKGMLSFTKAPITMEATESRVRFSGPESAVDMELVEGFQRPGDQGAQPALGRLPGLHPVPLGLTHPFNRGAHVEPQGYERFTSKWSAGTK